MPNGLKPYDTNFWLTFCFLLLLLFLFSFAERKKIQICSDSGRKILVTFFGIFFSVVVYLIDVNFNVTLNIMTFWPRCEYEHPKNKSYFIRIKDGQCSRFKLFACFEHNSKSIIQKMNHNNSQQNIFFVCLYRRPKRIHAYRPDQASSKAFAKSR